jgi:hypothetical protein
MSAAELRHTLGVALTRGWKIALAVIGVVIALTAVSLWLFNTGESAPGTGEGDPITGLTTP